MYELEATADVLLMTAQAKPSLAEPSVETVPETALVEGVLAGNRDLFGRLYQLYAPLVHGVLLARLPRSEVEDMVQDIFLHAFRKLHTLRDTLAFRLVEGMSGPEIATRTGLTPASVRVNLHRGMKLLREKLGFEEG
jgi:DNA-directed RNA polymerase specialized sigma24 family protein